MATPITTIPRPKPAAALQTSKVTMARSSLLVDVVQTISSQTFYKYITVAV
ncbi:hypothetical protein WUBG_09055, partial [Wuchereria bancrofti]